MLALNHYFLKASLYPDQFSHAGRGRALQRWQNRTIFPMQISYFCISHCSNLKSPSCPLLREAASDLGLNNWSWFWFSHWGVYRCFVFIKNFPLCACVCVCAPSLMPGLVFYTPTIIYTQPHKLRLGYRHRRVPSTHPVVIVRYAIISTKAKTVWECCMVWWQTSHNRRG